MLRVRFRSFNLGGVIHRRLLSEWIALWDGRIFFNWVMVYEKRNEVQRVLQFSLGLDRDKISILLLLEIEGRDAF